MSLFDMDTIIHMPIDEIKVGVQLQNIRTWFEQDKIEELAQSIYNEGLMSPVIIMDSVNESGEDIIELVAGERRLRAIKHIRNTIDANFFNEVPCIQFEGTYHDAVFAAATENIAREQVDDVDTAAWIVRQVDDGVTQTEISERIHKSVQYVNFRYTFHNRACDEVKQALREGIISFYAAYELTKNLGPDEQAKWINKARRDQSRISLAQAKVAGSSNKSTKPSKRKRDRMLARATAAVDDRGSETARGLMFALSWVDGLTTDEEIEDVIATEEGL